MLKDCVTLILEQYRRGSPCSKLRKITAVAVFNSTLAMAKPLILAVTEYKQTVVTLDSQIFNSGVSKVLKSTRLVVQIQCLPCKPVNSILNY